MLVIWRSLSIALALSFFLSLSLILFLFKIKIYRLVVLHVLKNLYIEKKDFSNRTFILHLYIYICFFKLINYYYNNFVVLLLTLLIFDVCLLIFIYILFLKIRITHKTQIDKFEKRKLLPTKMVKFLLIAIGLFQIGNLSFSIRIIYVISLSCANLLRNLRF